MAQLEFDESLVAQLEELYSKRDVLRRRALVREALAAQPGERILDIGCGPGFYVAELLEEVGDEGSVTGVDSSPAMLAVAARRAEGRGNVEFHEAGATSLPVEDASFDRALSVQVMEYVPEIPAALAEIHRVLRPGGRVLIWDVDWATVSWHAVDQERMRRVLKAWDKHLTHPSLPQTLAAQLSAAGFEDVRMDAHPFATIELTPEAYGGALATLLEQYVVEQGGMDEDDAKAWATEQRELGERGEFYFVVVQACFTATTPG
jgi:ubiquinone/menaquinone biosynthesis C-methylase UbiE